MRNKLLLLVIAAQLAAFGTTLKLMDSDNKGNDDLFGQILESGGNGLRSYANNDEKGVKKYLLIVADAIYDFFGFAKPTT